MGRTVTSHLPRILLLGLALTGPPAGAAASAPAAGPPAAAVQVPAASRSVELQGIVVLCARGTDGDELRRAWSAYVTRYHEPGADLDQLIEQVLNRASAYRQRGHSATGQLAWNGAERQQLRSLLYAAARDALHEEQRQVRAAP